MPNDDRDQPVKRKRATQECDPPGIAGRVCDGLSRRRRKPSASCPHRQFGALPHASKNSTIGARRTLACASDPKLHFTLNHYNSIDSHGQSHKVVYQTARTDLVALAKPGLLTARKVGREWQFEPADDLEEKLRRPDERVQSRG